MACAGNNGNFSGYFTLSRSIWQGCPISVLLFLSRSTIKQNSK